jgi:hypothetical protein
VDIRTGIEDHHEDVEEDEVVITGIEEVMVAVAVIINDNIKLSAIRVFYHQFKVPKRVVFSHQISIK